MLTQNVKIYAYNGFDPFFTVWTKKLPSGDVAYGATDFTGNMLLHDLDHMPSFKECIEEFRVQDGV